MENKFGLLHIFRMFDLVLPEHCEFLLFYRHIAGGVSIYSISTIFSLFCFFFSPFRLVAAGCVGFGVVQVEEGKE